MDRWVVVVFDNEQMQGQGFRATGFPMQQVQQAVTMLIEACSKFGITFVNRQPTIFHAGDVVSSTYAQ